MLIIQSNHRDQLHALSINRESSRSISNKRHGEKSQLRPSDRRGIAAVELAICAPVLILLSVALIELGSLIFVKQSLAIAAYEGAHHGVQPAATATEAIAAAQEILDQRRIQGAQISVIPGDLPRIPAGDLFTVRVTAPSNSNSIAIFRLFTATQLEAEAVVMKETEPQ
ncbi:TadE/TadG family type IV pilus assembly protein [Neorhodopirellula pilleata]|uniref:TadE-like protein n=1 Tax=Neorhodopirellula pilleata TaxID=2714738 RepID=A0A5C5ZFT6_9BACT|nr:TadE family protein [Neorhodopirellula pilleata]TWT86058.1 TadE-like protein [Neorhodopirellula pilleata]